MLDCYIPACVAMNHNDRKDSGTGPHSSKLDMKSKSYKNSESWNHHYHGSRNSAEDPGIASSRTDKHLLSNVRNHPQAEPHGRSYSSSSDSSQRKKALPSSNHVYNHVVDKLSKSASKLSDSTPHNGKRKRSHDDKDSVGVADDNEGEWTEHVSSSSGRTYYYNKKLDKSQWEPPESMAKKARLNPPSQSGSSHAKSGSSSSNHDSRRGEGSSRTSSRSRGNSRERSHTHKDKSRRDVSSSGSRDSSSRRGGTAHERSGGGDRSGGGAQDRGGGGSHHESSRKRYRDSRRSVSHSNSTSPVPLKHHSSSSSRGHTLKGSSTHSKGVTSGRSHGGTRDRTDKSRQTTPGCHGNRSAHASPSTSSTPKGSAGTPGIQLISPTTPGSSAGNIPASLSQTLSNNQQLIEQNSLLIEQRQKFLIGENVTMATPTVNMTTPTSAQNMLASTPPTHLHQPIARKKLSLNPQMAQSPPGGIFPVTLATSTSVVGGVPYTPTGTPAQVAPGGCGVPTTPQTTPNLHPLQKALLLHNQQQQQQQQQQLVQLPSQVQLTPSPYPSGGVVEQLATPTATISHVTPTTGHATPTTGLHATPTALPHHMTSLSHPNSPRLQSPLGPPETPPLVPANIHPLTPAQQTVFTMPGVLPSPNIEGVIPVSTYPLVSSALLQRPVSRLGYQGVSIVDPPYPGGSLLEDMGLTSRVDLSLADRSLLTPWALQTETSGKQMDQCKWDAWRRRVVDAAFHSGRLATRRLSLESAQVRSFSRGQRLACVQSLLMELDKR